YVSRCTADRTDLVLPLECEDGCRRSACGYPSYFRGRQSGPFATPTLQLPRGTGRPIWSMRRQLPLRFASTSDTARFAAGRLDSHYLEFRAGPGKSTLGLPGQPIVTEASKAKRLGSRARFAVEHDERKIERSG